MKQVKLLFIIAVLCTTFTHSWAINLATWTFTGLSGGSANYGPSPFAPASSSDSVTVVGLTRGSGIATTGIGAGAAWGGNGFMDGLAAASQTAATAIAAGNFITFSFTADPGFNISLTQIGTHNIRRSGTGPANMLWQYSLNGTDFTDIGTTITIGTTTNGDGNTQPAITLSGIPALQNVASSTTITFRAVMWNSSNATGTWYFNAGTVIPTATLAITGEVNSTPLALDLISFNGQSGNNVNQLNWVTANEKNVSRFELQRGADGQHFEKIAVVNAKGNDKSADNHYTYNDTKTAATAYYRLLMINTDGTATYSNVVELRNDSRKQNIHVYPNPATTTLFLDGVENVSSYSITDVLGRNIVPANAISAENTLNAIDISSLEHGVYFLQLSSNSGKETIRFIKK